MGLFGSSDPAKQTEKVIAKEAKTEDKQLKQAIKDFARAEKQEAHAAKEEHHAHSTHDKAAKVEQKLSAELHKVEAKHNSAISHENSAAQDINTKTSEHQRVAQELARKKAALDQLQHNHTAHESTREQKLNELHQSNTAAPVGAGGAGLPLDQQYRQDGVAGAGMGRPDVGAAPIGGGLPAQSAGQGIGREVIGEEQRMSNAVHRM